MPKSEQQHLKLIEAVKMQLVMNDKQIIVLTAQRDRLQAGLPRSGATEIQGEIEAMQKEERDFYNRISEMRRNIAIDEKAFSDSQAYLDKQHETIKTISKDIESLRTNQYSIQIKA